jgi:fumarylacetoacetate (FAA) hydrolase family protein
LSWTQAALAPSQEMPGQAVSAASKGATRVNPGSCRSQDGGTLVGRVWIPSGIAGPSVVSVVDGLAYDITARTPTMSALLEHEDAVGIARSIAGLPLVGPVDDLAMNSIADPPDPRRPRLLAPCDLQAIKACGVTFMTSLIERVIEERAGGDPGKADALRKILSDEIGQNLRDVRPGSTRASALKEVLVAKGMWSQYLEVAIGPDAEVFTKSQVLSAVGYGCEIGIHPDSAWNNPEPEIVLAVDSHGRIRGATLGNDVNLRDIEGRSALLLGKAKDNNASCAIGPFLRLFDERFSLDDVRNCTVSVKVVGADGFKLESASYMQQISRDPEDLVRQTINDHHHYPDGLMLFLGTMFAPIADRELPGSGFTHHRGDIVEISSPQLGRLINRVKYTHETPAWSFGISALMNNLARRGLLDGSGGTPSD